MAPAGLIHPQRDDPVQDMEHAIDQLIDGLATDGIAVARYAAWREVAGQHLFYLCYVTDGSYTFTVPQNV